MGEGQETPGQDEYERKYMAGGQAMAHSRMRMPPWFNWLMLVTGVASAVAVTSAVIVSHGAAAPAYFSVLLCFLVWLLFSHVRCTVTKEFVHVQFGLFGPKVPIENVISATIEKYDWKKYGGWGIKGARDGTWAYSVPGGKGIGVRLVYRNAKGKECKAFVSADNAEDLVSAIALAQGGRSAAKARIEGPADDAEVAAAQAEADAVLAEASKTEERAG